MQIFFAIEQTRQKEFSIELGILLICNRVSEKGREDEREGK